MRIKIHKKIKHQKGLLIAPFFKEELKKPPKNYPEAVRKFAEKEFKAKKNQTKATYLNKKDLPEKLLLIGLGKTEKYNVRTAKEAGGKIGKYAKTTKSREVTILLPKKFQAYAKELLEGILMSQYEVEKFKSKKKEKQYKFDKLHIITENPSKILKKDLEKAQIINSGVEYVKDLVNTPSSIVDVEYLAREAQKIARKNRYKIVVLGHSELKKRGWGGLLAVNQGSAKEAKCIALQYDGAKNKREKPIVIVGKGIVFDTGGYNLKPTKYIETMHQDMAGGAVVLGIFEILKKLRIKKNIVGIIPAAENMIGSRAYRPSDIICMLSGKTVEITNTDAEGRLILADGITYGIKFKPESIITIATLTGAVITALGDRYAGLISNNYELRKKIERSGRLVDELAWPLPLHRDHKKKMDSTIADIRNCDTGTSYYAGASKGAAFLERFVEKNKWCHIDIGGTAFTDDPKKYETKGATAHGLQILVKFLES